MLFSTDLFNTSYVQKNRKIFKVFIQSNQKQTNIVYITLIFYYERFNFRKLLPESSYVHQ